MIVENNNPLAPEAKYSRRWDQIREFYDNWNQKENIMAEPISLEHDELTVVNTHVSLIQRAYRKVESQQYASRELENDFRDFINNLVREKGGDVNLQQSLNTDTGTLEPVSAEEAAAQQAAQENGAGVIEPELIQTESEEVDGDENDEQR